MDKTIELMVCVDCLFALANGDYPEDEARAAAVVNGENDWFDHGYALSVLDGEHTTFSWSGCDVCRSTLGGSRHPAVALKR